MTPLEERLRARIASTGPLTVAEFMEAALYDPDHGYYTTATQRSGRQGDFYTSVDVGPLFGAVLARVVAAASRALRAAGGDETFDLVEVAAGNGRLMRDLLDALAEHDADSYAAARVALVERSPAARAGQPAVLGPHAGKITSSGPDLPSPTRGLVFANELLDAFPVHRVVMTRTGLAEAHVGVDAAGRLSLRLGPLSSSRLADYFAGAAVTLEPGAVADVSLAAVDWIAAAGRRLARGYLLLLDYGHEAPVLFSGGASTGTLRGYAAHLVDAPYGPAAGESRPSWLERPGLQDLTAHVDFTAVTAAAARAGLRPLGRASQSAFLIEYGLTALLPPPADQSVAAVTRRLAARALVLPGGPGGAHQALLFGRDVEPLPGFGPRRGSRQL
jgi:SAM-dependent MidA family methyltransferase